ncbi:MAG: hypothetical protein AVDCRST_MAG14-1598 [uncultured Rubrobacteraceae bacterium]|uniref:Methyltransferase domain-containing protein n=1 Tax=uncultured Rubrobacteraceae bacterium TaxID=349277 RepID=A0A6J4QWT3_9ACTN|nr:MAG: hypothetical protein AVDCRST_MAG14-1598 [uncultured Rubrobacteraceae bacterium]
MTPSSSLTRIACPRACPRRAVRRLRSDLIEEPFYRPVRPRSLFASRPDRARRQGLTLGGQPHPTFVHGGGDDRRTTEGGARGRTAKPKRVDLGREGYSLPGAGEERPHRAEGERALLKIERPSSARIALDFSPTMLEAARHRFEGDRSMRVVEHDLREPLPDLEPFEAIVSCFAIHRCKDERKRALYAEIYALSKQGGAFYNLEIVSSPTQRLRERSMVRAIRSTLQAP